MYSYEQRKKAVELYLKYKSYSAVINELEYPSRGMLRQWYHEYLKDKDLHQIQTRTPKYGEKQIHMAVDYYLTHGRCVSKTIRELGYPSRQYLERWLTERIPDYKIACRVNKSLVNLSQEEKKQAVIELCTKEETAKTIANKYNINRGSLYNWKNELLGKERVASMPKNNKKIVNENIEDLQQQVSTLAKQAEELHREIYLLQLEKDILEVAAEVIKKGQGITLQTLTNREKAIVIDALRTKYSLKELLSVFHMAKSSYCYQKKSMHTDKYAQLKVVIKELFVESSRRYGYRRIYSIIKSRGIIVSEKVIRRIMKQENLIVPNIKRKKYSSYQGEVSPEVANIINRNFRAAKPNNKWLTDITEFHIPAGKIYLSPIIDCFDGLPVSWTIGTSPSSELVNTMLDKAISTLNDDEKPIIHSDRGCHYRWPGWIERINKAGLTRSMSKKGCSPDNSACEGFFGRLKNEMFYGYSWIGVTIDEFVEHLDNYIRWYAEKRIKLSLGGMSPLDYRKNLGLVV